MSSVDSKEFSEFANAKQPCCSRCLPVWLTTKEAADIIAQSWSRHAEQQGRYLDLRPGAEGRHGAVAKSKVQFVLGDLLPGDLVDEYRVQLQKFLQDPSDANIDAVAAAIEAKAKTFD